MYKLTNYEAIIRLEDNATIPKDENNFIVIPEEIDEELLSLKSYDDMTELEKNFLTKKIKKDVEKIK